MIERPGWSSTRVGVRALVVRGTQILFNVNRDINGVLHYVLPGGGQEHGEGQIEALQRECEEEIGVCPRVYDLAFTWDFIIETTGEYRNLGNAFHQQNLAFWCGLAPGDEPKMGAGKDTFQTGIAWLDVADLHTVDVHPREIAEWLQSDPSVRPRTLGTLRPTFR